VDQHEPEKRRFLRYDVRSTVELTSPAGREILETVDLGAGGCRLPTGRRIEKGLRVTVQLSSERSHLRPRGLALVAWASHAEPFHIGLAFDDDLAEQVIGFMKDLLGAVPIRTGD
jgi:hypothetical protein